MSNLDEKEGPGRSEGKKRGNEDKKWLGRGEGFGKRT